MNLQPVVPSEVKQEEKNKYTLTHICGIQKNGTDEPIAWQEQKHRCKEETCGHSGDRREWGELREQH